MGLNGIIVVDKPADWTSHDVVAKLRGILGERRIGHGGTLDPMATGVLPVFIGRATGAASLIENSKKEYLASLRTGVVTDTQDITGTVLETTDRTVSAEDVQRACEAFLGVQEQIPPMYSAVKRQGKKLYELARKGVEVEREARTIEITALELLGRDGADWRLRVECSKGTYVRTLVHDMGRYLGCGGTLSALRRTRAGFFTCAEARTLDEIRFEADRGRAASLLRGADSLFMELPELSLDQEETRKCRCGVFLPTAAPDGRVRVYGPEREFLMIGIVSEGMLKAEKTFFEVRA